MEPLAETRKTSRSRCGDESIAASVLKIDLWAPAFTGFAGGIGAFSRELASCLPQMGHEVRLFGKLDHPGFVGSSKLWGTGQYTHASRSHVFALGCLAAAARRRPEHIISTHLNFGRVAHLAKRTLGIPYTLVAHGIDVHSGLPIQAIAALRAADRIVAVSSWTRLRVLDLGGIEPSSVSVLPNTLDESRFQIGDKPQSLVRKYGLRENEKVVLTVARLAEDERYKGYDRIVQSLPILMHRFGDVRFIVVGKGEDRARVERLADALGVRDAVTFAGFVPDDELADHYRLADVFAMPSTGEGFGIVFLEAMGCGTPVVAGNRDGSSDALAGGELGRLVDPNDVGAIADGISSVLAGEGPGLWHDRAALRCAVVKRFGRQAFRESAERVLALS